jgi:hypothetical protein
MALSASTGLRNTALHTTTVRDVFNRGCSKLKIFSGTAPVASGSYAAADAAETGTLLCTITNAGASVKAAEKIRFTPTTAGTTGTWTITVNGVAYEFTDDASPTATEICTGWYRLINTAQGAAAKYFTNSTDGAITAGGRLNIPGTYQKYTLTDNTGTLDIASATAGETFDYSATATGAGNSVATASQVSDAYGLHFEAVADIASGIIEKLSTETWEGTVLFAGTATHYRLILDADTGALSTTQKRIQGTVSTANADLNFASGVNFAVDDIKRVNSFSVTWPAAA